MIIGIVGIGVVGGALMKSFQKKCIPHICYDKYKKIGSFEELLTASMLFLCLPTLYSSEKKEYDKSAIEEVCQRLSKTNYRGLVILKSTVEPSTTRILSKKYGLKMLHNPEFLSAETAYHDFHHQTHLVIGRSVNVDDADVEQVIEFFKEHYNLTEISSCLSDESELMKIAVNNFYAVKIQFFNEVFFATQKLGINYEVVLKMMLKNGWINPMHTAVPGSDGKYSYGGMCFPKDTNAFYQFLERNGLPSAVVKATIEERNEMRDD